MKLKQGLPDLFIFALFVLLFIFVMMIFSPFFYDILWALLIYIVLLPLYKKLLSKYQENTRKNKRIHRFFAGIFTIGALLIIIAPVLFTFIELIRQGISVITGTQEFLHNHPTFISDSLSNVNSFLMKIGINVESALNANNIQTTLMNYVQAASSTIIKSATSIISGTSRTLISFFLIVFILYFLFLDGSYLGSIFVKVFPIQKDQMDTIFSKFNQTAKGLLIGYGLVAVYQGFVAFILMIASFIPMLGAACIWLPAGLFVVFTHSVWEGVIFLVLSAVFISFLDNFIRPFLLKDRINVHPLIIFFAILGGIRLFGMSGIILGPLIVILLFTVIDLLTKNTKKDLQPLA